MSRTELPLEADTGYRPDHTLPVRVELVRQLKRRRTQVTFGLVALLPVILWSRSRWPTTARRPAR